MTNDPVRAAPGLSRAWRVQVLTGLVVAVFATSAVAQVQRVDMGRGMDANPQVGAGGSNRPVQGYVPINGNDIISGNVSGLKAFHAPVGTASTYEFRAPLGTSTLENFARQSAGGSNSLGSAVSESYFLPSRVVSGGGINSTPFGSGFDSQYVPRNVVSPSAPSARSAGLLGTQGSSFDRVPQSTQLAPGTPGGLLSSPIFVMRDLSSPEPSEGQRSTNVLRATGTQERPGTSLDNNTDLLNGQNRTEQNRLDNNAEQDTGTGDIARRTRTDEQRNAAIGPRDTVDNEPTGVYRDLLGELRKAQADVDSRESKEAAQAASVGVNVVPGTRSPVTSGATVASGTGQQKSGQTKPRGTNLISDDDLDPLTGQPRIGAGLTPRGRGATTRPSRPTMDSLSPKGLEEVPQSTLSSGARVKPLVSLVPPRESAPTGPFNTLLARAETLLKDGKYMDAAATYEQALMRQPDNALALVGKAHAELGAGAYQSAAYDLKFVFTRNPQMVGVQYKMETFISPVRQDFLVKDLSTLSQNNKEMVNTTEFLLSYLYYQTGKQQQLRAELQRWGDTQGHDNWQTVLRRAWLTDATTRPGEGGGTR